ncbi:MAG TPA: hypothetical protein VE487_17890 [Ilumatobacter sp.]|jgi:hypothetical protein|nr:hypothetical protein [Ilumatobacter sp.]
MHGVTKCIPLIALLALGSAACGGGDDDDAAGDEDTTAETVRVTPPPPTAPAGTAAPAATTTDLLNRLAKAGDIGDLQLGIPAVAAIRILSVEVPQDPTGPCGAAIEPLTLEGGAGRTYDTVKGRIIGVVVPRDPTVDAWIEANRADLTAGCPSHETTIGADTVTLSAPEPVDISATTPEGVAWVSTIEQPPDGGQRAVLILPTTDLVVVVTMTSPEPIEPAFVQTMADVWYAKATAA